jgi:undecaprenyl diphosphate synthase
MDLFIRTLKKEIEALHRNGVRIRFIGDRSAFPDLREQIPGRKRGPSTTGAQPGGRRELRRPLGYHSGMSRAGAARRRRRSRTGDITADMIGGQISLSDLPSPIFHPHRRKQRISNFLLWQLAYTELYFTEILWPAFDEKALDDALQSYASRQRRFGRTGEQVEQLKGA